MIHDQHLFSPIIEWALAKDPSQQPAIFYLANGFLSMISDNVFVATVYINELRGVFDPEFMNETAKQTYDALSSQGKLDFRQQYENLAIAVNTGTNLPSVATPNGQAAFLFLLTSALAPLINLSYGKMVKMALPYTIVLGGAGLLGILYIL
jgi:NhaB family Na+:H+ antiporter